MERFVATSNAELACIALRVARLNKPSSANTSEMKIQWMRSTLDFLRGGSTSRWSIYVSVKSSTTS